MINRLNMTDTTMSNFYKWILPNDSISRNVFRCFSSSVCFQKQFVYLRSKSIVISSSPCFQFLVAISFQIFQHLFFLLWLTCIQSSNCNIFKSANIFIDLYFSIFTGFSINWNQNRFGTVSVNTFHGFRLRLIENSVSVNRS